LNWSEPQPRAATISWAMACALPGFGVAAWAAMVFVAVTFLVAVVSAVSSVSVAGGAVTFGAGTVTP